MRVVIQEHHQNTHLLLFSVLTEGFVAGSDIVFFIPQFLRGIKNIENNAEMFHNTTKSYSYIQNVADVKFIFTVGWVASLWYLLLFLLLAATSTK